MGIESPLLSQELIETGRDFLDIYGRTPVDYYDYSHEVDQLSMTGIKFWVVKHTDNMDRDYELHMPDGLICATILNRESRQGHRQYSLHLGDKDQKSAQNSRQLIDGERAHLLRGGADRDLTELHILGMSVGLAKTFSQAINLLPRIY